MLIYIILFVVVIGVIGFVLKKQKDAQAAQNNTATTRNKATGSSAKPAPSKTKVVEEPIAVKKEATPLAPDLRKKIEGLIHEHNFFAAEAQINQALKKDNTQHELYLLLLDLHILQKDEFAISQLINHIQSLGLDEIIAQAEIKKAEFDKSLNAVKDTIDFQPSQTHTPEPEPAAPIVDNSAAFEELSPTRTTDNDAFDQLQQNVQAEKTVEVAPTDTAPLEFNFEPSFSSTETKAVEESTAAPLEFTEKTAIETPKAEEPAPLDFNFSIEPTSTETSLQVEEKAAEPAIDNEPKLDFSFTALDTPIEEKPVVAEKVDAAPSLDFDFTAAPATTETPAVEVAKETAQEPNLDFDLTAPKLATTQFDVEKAVPPTPVDTSDPLVQSFAELADVNEATLNLDLAAQYIQLGAYQAAREILDEKQEEYSAEQRQLADELRKQIA